MKRKLYTLRMSESISVTDHINNLNTLFSKLAAMDYNIKESERAELLLQSLPDSYDQLIINLTNNVLTDFLDFNDVAAAVLQEESRRKSNEDRSFASQQTEALLTMRGRSTERNSSGSQNPGRSKSRSKKYIKCHFCGKRGHIKRDCWNYKKSIEKTSEGTTSQGCVASPSDEGEILCADASITPKANSLTDVWVLDSGATWHMMPRRDWFRSYKPIPKGYVFKGDDRALEIVGTATIKLMMHDEIVHTIQEVRHVKGLKKNLLSTGQFDDLGLRPKLQMVL